MKQIPCEYKIRSAGCGRGHEKGERSRYKLSETCARLEKSQLFGGNGNVQMKVLATADEMYKGARLFNHVTLQPGCSLGFHHHEHETEFYYIIKGEGVFNDNGTEVVLKAGDRGATGYGEGHSIENRSDEPMEMIALIVTE